MAGAVRGVLGRPLYLVIWAVAALALFGVYVVLDLRAPGAESGLFVFGNFMAPAMMVEVYGPAFVFSAVGLNIAVAYYRSRQAATGAACSTGGAMVIGLSAFA